MKSKGFTLIELLVVIAIIGILATVVVASLGTARDRARTARAQMEISQIKTIMTGVQISTGQLLGQITGVGYTTSNACTGDLSILVSSACETPWRNAINAITTLYDSNSSGSSFYEDPWGNPYVLDVNEGEPGEPPCIINTLLSAGPNQIVDGGGDDIIVIIPFERCSG